MLRVWAEHQSHNLTVCAAFGFRHGPPVDIHRRLDRSVTHQFLLHLHRSTRFVEAGAIGMAECVPPNVLSQPGQLRSPLELPFPQALLVVRPSR
jgi:hypothetical protein